MTDDYTLPKVGPEPYTEQWFAARSSIFGASEAAAVCGLSRYSQPLEVYNRKKGISSEKTQTPEMRRGQIFESAVLQMYEDRVGGGLWRTPPMFIHPKWEFMTATPDAMWNETCVPSIGDMTWRDCIPVEAKTTRTMDGFGDEGGDDIPQEYILQAQQQMAVTGKERCDVPVCDGFDLKVYKVLRNDDVINFIIDSEKEMAERIKGDDPPPVNWSHPKTYDMLKKVNGVNSEEVVELSESMTAAWQQVEVLSRAKSDLDKQIKGHKAMIMHAMGTAGVGKMTDGRCMIRKKITRKSKEMPAIEFFRLMCRK
jgi:putative phage-type endonuclease